MVRSGFGSLFGESRCPWPAASSLAAWARIRLRLSATTPDHWCGYQSDRPDLGEGIALFFHRRESPYSALDANLRALDETARYEVARQIDYGRPKWQSAAGETLANTRIEIGNRPGSLLLRYRETR